jgi:hypothetical protein
VMQQPALLLPQFGGKVFTHFHAVTVKHHHSMWNWLFGLPGQILCEQCPWCQRKLWKCPWLSPSVSIERIVALSQGHNCNHNHSSYHHW